MEKKVGTATGSWTNRVQSRQRKYWYSIIAHSLRQIDWGAIKELLHARASPSRLNLKTASLVLYLTLALLSAHSFSPMAIGFVAPPYVSWKAILFLSIPATSLPMFL